VAAGFEQPPFDREALFLSVFVLQNAACVSDIAPRPIAIRQLPQKKL
jgi:hypothetical protein